MQKNKAAMLGADSIKFIGSGDVSTKAAFSQPGDTVTVEAFRCNLKRKHTEGAEGEKVWAMLDSVTEKMENDLSCLIDSPLTY